MGEGGTTKWAPYYRCYNSSGTQLYSGHLVCGDGTGASGTWGISISGNAATATALGTDAGSSTIPVYFTGGKPSAITTDTAPYTATITVTGDANTYYPVQINYTGDKTRPHIISIWKNLGSTTASYSGNHSNGTSSMWLMYEHRFTGWDGNGGYCRCIYHKEEYATLVAKTEVIGGPTGGITVWLRGGTTEYKISSDYNISATPYYSKTDVGSPPDYSRYVEPTTTVVSNGWRIDGTFYGNCTGNAGGVAWENVSDKPNICTTDTAQTITGNKSWGTSGAGGILYGNATNGGINSMRIGDDVYLGDCNAAGIMGMKSTSTNCGFYMHNSSGTQIGQLYANGTGFYINKTLQVHPDTGSYTEGIRIYPYGSWATIMLLGNDNTATNGTSTNSWGMFNNNGTFYINRATSSGAGASRVYANSNGWYFDKAYGAVWNDFAEYRQANTDEPGRVIIPSSDGIAKISTERL